MSRIPNIRPDEFTESQQKLFASITGGKRGQESAVATFLNPEGGLRGPFNALLFSPALGEAAQRLGEAVRFEGALPPQLREVAILTVAAKWQAQYEWWAHAKIAREAGLDPAIIAAIKAGTLSDNSESAHAIVFHFAQELLEGHQVGDQRYAQTVALLGEAGVVELVILLGYYTLVSMTLNVFEVPVPAGEDLPFNSADHRSL